MSAKNFMEILVDQSIEEALITPAYRDSSDCHCKVCLARIKAEALNNIKPFYVTGKVGEVFGVFGNNDLQSKANIMREVVKAIEIVRAEGHK